MKGLKGRRGKKRGRRVSVKRIGSSEPSPSGTTTRRGIQKTLFIYCKYRPLIGFQQTFHHKKVNLIAKRNCEGNDKDNAKTGKKLEERAKQKSFEEFFKPYKKTRVAAIRDDYRNPHYSLWSDPFNKAKKRNRNIHLFSTENKCQ